MSALLIGVDTTNPTSDITKAGGGGHGLNNRWSDKDGNDWIFVKASVAFTLGDCVFIKPTGHGAPITDTLAKTPGRIGFAQVAFTVDYFGWVQTMGALTLRAAASCNANVQLYTTATAGVLDDATASTSQLQVMGVIASQSATSGGVTAVTGFANYPMIRRIEI